MKNLVALENDNVVISPYAKLISEFAKLSPTELGFVYFFCDYRSPYSAYTEDDRLKILLEDFKIKSVSKQLQAAIDKYRQLSETHSIRLLVAARESVNRLEEYLREIDLTQLNERGTPIFTARDLVANLTKLGEVVEGLQALEELVRKEATIEGPNRGGVKVNKFSE
jgi:hypothetical protein